jgi:hypothetical protein
LAGLLFPKLANLWRTLSFVEGKFRSVEPESFGPGEMESGSAVLIALLLLSGCSNIEVSAWFFVIGRNEVVE